PACGSGAFLIEAFQQMHDIYQQSNGRLAELRGPGLFDVDKTILTNNLFCVDLNQEALEICRVSWWVKTARHGKELTTLDQNSRVGNSVIADPAAHPLALDWRAAFPQVFGAGGFDVVVCNPPYIRAEWISEFKAHFQQHFKAFDSSA